MLKITIKRLKNLNNSNLLIAINGSSLLKITTQKKTTERQEKNNYILEIDPYSYINL